MDFGQFEIDQRFQEDILSATMQRAMFVPVLVYFILLAAITLSQYYFSLCSCAILTFCHFVVATVYRSKEGAACMLRSSWTIIDAICSHSIYDLLQATGQPQVRTSQWD